MLLKNRPIHHVFSLEFYEFFLNILWKFYFPYKYTIHSQLDIVFYVLAGIYAVAFHIFKSINVKTFTATVNTVFTFGRI